MVCASGVVNQDTVLGNATRTRINWPSLQLAVETTNLAKNNARSYGRVHANHVDLNEAQDHPSTVMGTLLVNSVPASVLFDSGASHSFMSEDFAYKHDVKCEEMNTSVVVKTPRGTMSNLTGWHRRPRGNRRAGILCLSHYPEVV